jgi:hypothetical protein
MITRYNRISLAIGIPGAILQFLGFESKELIGPVIAAIGTILLLIGLAYYLKAKGQSPIWCILAFFWLFGIIALSFFPDRRKNDQVVSAVKKSSPIPDHQSSESNSKDWTI